MIGNEVTIDDIIKGEIEVPPLLREFITYLIHGPDSSVKPSDSRQLKIESISEDIVYAVTNSRKKPAKNMQLGLALKSMTGSRKVIELICKLGHCVSYSTVESLETELTYSATASSRVTPTSIQLLANLKTGVAFDNFEFVDTINGKDTLHDTVGIVYQDVTAVIPSTPPPPTIAQTSNNTNSKTPTALDPVTRRRRKFDVGGTDVEPYHKRPKMTTTMMVDNEDERRHSLPAKLNQVKSLDDIWMMSLALNNDSEIPMWVGWNAKRVHEQLPMQKIAYLPQINHSPTSLAVVAETLGMSEKIAHECAQKYISVTFNLAIAKMAYAIQEEESPRFDNIFIHLGGFHIELAFFKALGKFIAEFGCPYVLTESGVLAQGSLKGFLSGTHYNR